MQESLYHLNCDFILDTIPVIVVYFTDHQKADRTIKTKKIDDLKSTFVFRT